MKNAVCFCVVLVPLTLWGQAVTPYHASNPYITNHGTVFDLPDVYLPSSDLDYKVVIDLKSSVVAPDQVNRGLNNVARLLNLLGTGGIPRSRIQIAVVIHGGATSIVLNDEAYHRKHGTDNPNLALIRELHEWDVELFVCGQSLLAREYDPVNVHSDVTRSLSMLTVVLEKMAQGHSLLVFE